VTKRRFLCFGALWGLLGVACEDAPLPVMPNITRGIPVGHKVDTSIVLPRLVLPSPSVKSSVKSSVKKKPTLGKMLPLKKRSSNKKAHTKLLQTLPKKTPTPPKHGVPMSGKGAY